MKTIKETLEQSVKDLLAYLSEDYYDGIEFNITESSLIRGTKTEGLYLFAISSEDESWNHNLHNGFQDYVEENIDDYMEPIHGGNYDQIETAFITRNNEFIIFIDVIL